MCPISRFFVSKKPKSHDTLMDEFFVAPTVRKIELARATCVSVACLHEAGHVLMAELHRIPVECVNLPRFDAFSSPDRPNETKKDTTPGVSVPNTLNSSQAVPYLLGGFFGEINVYDDEALKNPEQLQVYTYGCGGDFDQICKMIAAEPTPIAGHHQLAQHITDSLAASRNGADRRTFLETFPFQRLTEFKEFRNHQERHRSIAVQLYQRWKHLNFEQYYEANPNFGPYTY